MTKNAEAKPSPGANHTPFPPSLHLHRTLCGPQGAPPNKLSLWTPAQMRDVSGRIGGRIVFFAAFASCQRANNPDARHKARVGFLVTCVLQNTHSCLLPVGKRPPRRSPHLLCTTPTPPPIFSPPIPLPTAATLNPQHSNPTPIQSPTSTPHPPPHLPSPLLSLLLGRSWGGIAPTLRVFTTAKSISMLQDLPTPVAQACLATGSGEFIGEFIGLIWAQISIMKVPTKTLSAPCCIRISTSCCGGEKKDIIDGGR